MKILNQFILTAIILTGLYYLGIFYYIESSLYFIVHATGSGYTYNMDEALEANVNQRAETSVNRGPEPAEVEIIDIPARGYPQWKHLKNCSKEQFFAHFPDTAEVEFIEPQLGHTNFSTYQKELESVKVWNIRGEYIEVIRKDQLPDNIWNNENFKGTFVYNWVKDYKKIPINKVLN